MNLEGTKRVVSLCIVVLLITSLPGCTESNKEDKDSRKPEADYTVWEYSRSWVLWIKNISGPIKMNDVEYRLQNGSSVVVHGDDPVEGGLEEIRNISFRAEVDGPVVSNVIWGDRDGDEMLSNDDTISVLGIEDCGDWDSFIEAGVGIPGMVLELEYSPNDHGIMQAVLTGSPVATVAVLNSLDGYDIYFSSCEPSAYKNYTRYRLMNGSEIVNVNGTDIKGTLDDIRNVELRNQTNGTIESHVSWEDSNGDKKIGCGDTIILLDEDNDRWNNTDVEAGVAAPGMIFELIYIPTGTVIIRAELP